MSSSLQKLLSQVEHAYNNSIHTQSKSVGNGDAFNVFNVIGLWSEEVRLHSAMIKELLDPSGSHGCSDRFLRLFYNKVNNSPIPEEKSLAEARVEAEYYIGPISDDKKYGGRIDILVMVPQVLKLPSLIIENKIYALDQENQLLRYYTFGKKKFEDRFILTYLTLDGKKPSNTSIGDENHIKPNCISYSNDIMTWLHSCAQIAFDKPKVRETIIQYIDLLKQITENTMTKSDDIVNIIESSTENLVSGLQICARRNEIVKSAVLGPITTFLKRIAEKAGAEPEMNHVQVEFRPNPDLNTKGVKVDWGFEFLITSSVDKQQVCLKYIFDNWNLVNLYYGIDKAQTSVGIQASNIFGNRSDDWPWGWKWMKDAYKNWDCNNICTILEQSKMNDSDFEKEVIMAIKTASKLLNGANSE